MRLTGRSEIFERSVSVDARELYATALDELECDLGESILRERL
jgi:hypothetical protein